LKKEMLLYAKDNLSKGEGEFVFSEDKEAEVNWLIKRPNIDLNLKKICARHDG
jgi:hypothetical protein